MSMNHVTDDVIDAQFKEIDKMYTDANYWQPHEDEGWAEG